MTVLLTTACSGGSPAAKPEAVPTPGIAGVQVFSGLSHDHTQERVAYPQHPPVGGKHNPSWLACDTYAQEVPDETAVHSMEHGGIWITYRPNLPAGQVATLADVQKSNTQYVLVSPYADQTSPVVVSTWGLQLQVAGADDPRIVEFVRTYAGGNQGDEEGTPCKTGGLTLDQAKKAVH